MESLFLITGIFIGIWGVCCCSAIYELYTNKATNNEEYLLDL
jgi:hypothetical protein